MEKIIIALVSLMISICPAAAVNAMEKWAVRYNGPGNSNDWPTAIATDKFGNIYVTGLSEGSTTSWDFATLKYDPSGNCLWVRRYNGNTLPSPVARVDAARAIAVDGDGNVYVTGESVFPRGGGACTGYVTIKYDSNGKKNWLARYNRAGYTDRPKALTIDSGGNVYVTGASVTAETHQDYTTVKYNNNGVQQWVRHFGSGWSNDVASAIAVDALRNVYVTGYSPALFNGRDYVTVKYDTDGHQKWSKRYNGPGSGKDEPRSIKAVLASGWLGTIGVYVTGYSVGSDNQGDYATIKYDGAGTKKWTRRYSGPAEIPDIEPVALGADASGNIYVTGSGRCPSEYITIKYNSAGTLLWEKRFNGGATWDLARAMAVDNAGNVYVTGESDNGVGTSFDIVTVKYDTNGNQQWVERYDGPGHNRDEEPVIAVDGAGNVYVAGRSVGEGTGPDYVLLKY